MLDFSRVFRGLDVPQAIGIHQSLGPIYAKDQRLGMALQLIADDLSGVHKLLRKLTATSLVPRLEIPATDGSLSAWIGSFEDKRGAAFKELYVGPTAITDPDNAEIKVDGSAVTINGATFTLALNGITTAIDNALYEGSFTGILVSDDSTGTASGFVPGYAVFHPPGGGNFSAILYADPTLDCGRLQLRDGSESGGQDGLGRKVFLNGETGYAVLSGGLADGNNNEVLRIGTVANAVNDIAVFNAATGNRPKLAVSPGSGDVNATADLEGKGTGGWNVVGADKLTVNDVIVPQHFYITFRIPAGATAADYDGVQIVPDAAEIVSVTERHGTAASSGPTTIMVKKVPSGTALAAGTDTLSAGIDLAGTADTNAAGSLHGTPANYQLAGGDALGLVTTGTLTSVDSVTVTVKLKRI